ncbi:uncharacterized protein LOC126827257 [Patella vulgata]|uniref:uncharacterized protein LOC126827257 n=1 Tax=Patella vulgata TaxID=6465 RepID=UPI002180046A|nr:uncharacterized protein LOC126827257 [Patella vulgata]
MVTSGHLSVFCVVTVGFLTLITKGIRIISDPENLSYNQPFKLTCEIGSITDEIKWLYSTTEYFTCSSPYSAGICSIGTSAAAKAVSYDVNTTAGTSTVEINVTSSSQNVLWTCKHGVDMATYQITIKGKVQILENETNKVVNATIGSNATLNLKIMGYPRPTYTWYKKISETERQLNGYRIEDIDGPALKIKNVHQIDEGEYTVRITSAGSAAIIFTFKLNVFPEISSQNEDEETTRSDAGVMNTVVADDRVTQSDDLPLSVGALIGIGVAVGIVVSLIVFAVVMVIRRLRRPPVTNPSHNYDRTTNKKFDNDYRSGDNRSPKRPVQEYYEQPVHNQEVYEAVE